jgi:hypothetical protein
MNEPSERGKHMQKITPAMRRWCKEIKAGAYIQQLTTTLFSAAGIGGFTYVMAYKLVDAGLVDFSSGVAVLTEKGEKVAKNEEGER